MAVFLKGSIQISRHGHLMFHFTIDFVFNSFWRDIWFRPADLDKGASHCGGQNLQERHVQLSPLLYTIYLVLGSLVGDEGRVNISSHNYII